MKNYEVNVDTLAIIPTKDDKTMVYEKDASFLVEKTTNKIMEDSCNYFGSSLEGRKIGSRNLTGINYKVPIIIEESSEMIFFPTSSPRVGDCSWISWNNIKEYYKKDKKASIKFVNGEIIDLDISFGVLNNQILRSCQLQTKLYERKIVKTAKKTKKIV